MFYSISFVLLDIIVLFLFVRCLIIPSDMHGPLLFLTGFKKIISLLTINCSSNLPLSYYESN